MCVWWHLGAVGSPQPQPQPLALAVAVAVALAAAEPQLFTTPLDMSVHVWVHDSHNYAPTYVHVYAMNGCMCVRVSLYVYVVEMKVKDMTKYTSHANAPHKSVISY